VVADCKDDFVISVLFNTLHKFSSISGITCNMVVVIGNVREIRHKYVGHLESKERLRIPPAQLFHFS